MTSLFDGCLPSHFNKSTLVWVKSNPFLTLHNGVKRLIIDYVKDKTDTTIVDFCNLDAVISAVTYQQKPLPLAW